MTLIERRLELAASMLLPLDIAARFTQAQQGVLAIVADDCRQHGMCGAYINDIAIRTGCGRSTAKTAIREAIRLGFLARDEQGVLRIMSARWLTLICKQSVISQPC
jgi:hypothetical protein